MGAQSSHEHIFVDDAKSSIVTHAYPETFPTEQIVTDGIAALKKFKANGGGSIVDCTTVDLGRNMLAARKRRVEKTPGGVAAAKRVALEGR